MSRITAHESMIAVLKTVEGPVEICDANGRVLGRFIPESATDSVAARVFDPEEIARRKAQSTGRRRSTAEVLQRLDAMDEPR